MEVNQSAGSQRRKRGYNRLTLSSRRNLKVSKLGGSKRSWRLRLTPKLRLVRLASPLRLWRRLKNAYMNMMLKFAGNGSGGANAVNAFGVKRIPKARGVPMAYSRTEFENRLIFEIYKSMVDSFELGYQKQV
ncbi:phytochrome interacting factor 3 [Striga asiatica]|uniref:Phytochrome interacting factor 3 n=1 Tax=Striga asiatica TaxID=4170 RepID=A0A5A7PRV4_STRAF|nr:phytochrome interacting factor 3 [Striga asiatica]